MAIDPTEDDDVARPEMDAAADPDFNETIYLRAFPDIAAAVRSGVLSSGLAHFQQSGRLEGRLEKTEYRALLRASEPLAAVAVVPDPPRTTVDAMTLSAAGSALIKGWTDDRFDALTEVVLETGAGTRHVWTEFPRFARADVDRAVDGGGHRFGFLLVAAPIAAPMAAPMGGPIDPASLPGHELVLRYASGASATIARDPAVARDADLRDLALAALPGQGQGQGQGQGTGQGQGPGTGDLGLPAARALLDRHAGAQIAALNRLIVEQSGSGRIVERIGPRRANYRASVVTVARGAVEGLFPRLALVACGKGADACEFIVIITQTDRFEAAYRAVRAAHAALGVPVTLVLSPNADPGGFGEEVARDIAQSERLIFMDQTVVPRDPDWAAALLDLADNGPEAQTRLFGGMLFNPDGALAHAGYHFDHDVTFRADEAGRFRRVATLSQRRLRGPMPREAASVTAVSASFLSVRRDWLDRLGGFTRNYAGGALEDVDLCLRARQAGAPAWVHPLPMLLFEQLGPARPEPSLGGQMFNQWLLLRQWEAVLSGEIPA